MSDPWTSLGPIIGGGGILALVAAIIVYVTRGAIATAVAQAGVREIERLKGELATQLEKERQTFAREIERERQEAARALEQFKSELTLEAELRRQVATARVKTLGAIVEKGTGLISVISDTSPDANAGTIASEYVACVRQSAHLHSAATYEFLAARARAVLEAASAANVAKKSSDQSGFDSAFQKVKAICEEIHSIAREQLGVEPWAGAANLQKADKRV